MMEPNLAEPTSGEQLEVEGREPHLVQVGTIKEFLTGNLMAVKQEPAEGLPEEWELQWQEFLATLQPQDLARKNPQVTKDESAEDSKGLQASLKGTADACQWPRGGKGAQFTPCPRREAHEMLDPSLKVKEEIPDEEDMVSSEMRRRCFRQFCYRDAEGPREVCEHLWRLGCQWLKPETRSKEQILEMLILEQFLSILPLAMQSWVRGCGPETCAQVVALAEGFILREGRKLLEPKSKPDPSGVVQTQLSLEVVKDEGDSEFILLCNRQVRENEKTLPSEGPVHMADGVSLGRIKGGFSQGLQLEETHESQHRPGSPHKDHQRKTTQQTVLCEESEEGLWEDTFQYENCRCKREKMETDYEEKHTQDSDISEDPKLQVGEKLYNCTYCWEGFQEKSRHAKHEQTHTGAKPHECTKCGGCFRSSFHLKNHKWIHAIEKQYRCSYCKSSFSQKSSLIAHERTHTGEKPYKCSQCGLSLSRRYHLLRHKLVHTGEKPYKCSECGKSFGQKNNLITHKRTHTGEKPYKCLKCGKRFCEKASLNRHERIHVGDRRFKCSECAKSFLSSSDLGKHKITHMGQKRYKCPQCKKSFSQKSSLLIHDKTAHSGEEPYKCSYCGKSLSRHSHLVRHERIHTGEKPHQCTECHKSFSQKENLLKHQRTHTGEKPYECSTCDKKFAEKASLVRHKRTHIGERSYKCSECRKSFTSNSDLQKHKKLHTSESSRCSEKFQQRKTKNQL